ncbi:MAG: hypothetical protein KME13_21590 [Myxacorys californica WJT36-NPBG1]|nr:hypothetical protein [Myxacorys californica WJT36-NPBG1]
MFVNANRGKDSEPASPSDFYYFQSAAEHISIPAAACDAFFSCVRDGIMPAWAVPLCPIDKLESGRANGRVIRPRIWVGDGVVILLPRISGQQVTAPFAIVDGAAGVVDVKDPDSETWFAVDVPAGDCWMLDAEFSLVESKIVLLK